MTPRTITCSCPSPSMPTGVAARTASLPRPTYPLPPRAPGGLTITVNGLGDDCDPKDSGNDIGPGKLPALNPPGPPIRGVHEIVKLDIPQKASLERQAFIADLQTTDTAGADLKNFNVTMHIADQSGSETNLQGQRYVDLFAITAPQENNYTADHSILNTQTAESKWTLVPAAGLGGSDPNGTHYNVSATYTYAING